jgi:hypothetical protein
MPPMQNNSREAPKEMSVARFTLRPDSSSVTHVFPAIYWLTLPYTGRLSRSLDRSLDRSLGRWLDAPARRGGHAACPGFPRHNVDQTNPIGLRAAVEQHRRADLAQQARLVAQ